MSVTNSFNRFSIKALLNVWAGTGLLATIVLAGVAFLSASQGKQSQNALANQGLGGLVVALEVEAAAFDQVMFQNDINIQDNSDALAQLAAQSGIGANLSQQLDQLPANSEADAVRAQILEGFSHLQRTSTELLTARQSMLALRAEQSAQVERLDTLSADLKQQIDQISGKLKLQDTLAKVGLRRMLQAPFDDLYTAELAREQLLARLSVNTSYAQRAATIVLHLTQLEAIARMMLLEQRADLLVSIEKNLLQPSVDALQADVQQLHDTLADNSRFSPNVKAIQQRTTELVEVLTGVGTIRSARAIQTNILDAHARQNLAQAEGADAISRIRAATDRLTHLITSEIDLVRADAVSTANRTQTFSLAIGAAILLFTAAISGLIARRVNTNLTRTTHALQQIASGDGDLSRRLDADGRDEFAALGGSFNQFIGQLQKMITEVAQTTQRLSQRSNEAQSNTRHNQEQVTNQQNETREIANAMTQMTGSSESVAASVKSSASAITAARTDAFSAREVINKNMEVVSSLGSTLENATTVTRELRDECDNIGRILEVINAITEQTNLLALNAAIEAARAGESGRGFAVVADEVRALAQKTHDSTLEIRGIMQSIQSRADDAVDVMDSGQTLMHNSVSSTQQAVTALGGIATRIDEIAGMSEEMASAAQEQATVALQVNQSVNRIQTTASTTENSAREAGIALERLMEDINSLNGLIGHFKLN